MTTGLLILIAVLALAGVIVGVVALARLRGTEDSADAMEACRTIPQLAAALERLREDLARLEQSARADAASQRQELSSQLTAQRTELTGSIGTLHTNISASFKQLSTTLNDQVQQLTSSTGVATAAQLQSLTSLQQANAAASDALRTQIAERLDSVVKGQTDSGASLREELTKRLEGSRAAQQAAITELTTKLHEQMTATRAEITAAVVAMAKETGTTLSAIAERVSGQLSGQSKDAGESMEKLRATVEVRLTSIQAAADTKLEQMRTTVDEKLSATLNTRLGESFKMVSERLEAVQSGFGEMKSLAGNVTDLRRLMTNVKTRGVWGEVQLGNLLEQIFSSEQYEANFKPRPRSGEVVEFALKLPGPDTDSGPVYLPIDSKFPVEDYQRLIEASENSDIDGVKAAIKGLENRIYGCARDIRDKYIAVPTTTDFAILFLPTEGLYAEVLKIPGLVENLTRDYKVIVQGPTTFSAFTMALLMGFRTLAIQKQSASIGQLLGAVKSDFGKFADLLGKVEEKLDDAKNNIGKARQRSNQIVKKLGRVDELPHAEAKLLLPEPSTDPDSIMFEQQD